MKRIFAIFLILGLALPAAAQGKAFTSGQHHFSAVFHAHPVKTVHPRMGQVTFGHPPAEGARDWEAISVLTGRLRKSPLNTLNYLVSEGVLQPHSGPVKNVLLGKLKGIEVSGLNGQGIPFGVRIFTTPQETYVIMSTNIDLRTTRAFLQSFQLLPGK